MNGFSLIRQSLAALGALISVPALVRAEDSAASPDSPRATVASPFHADAEVDPTAYVFNGYSLHVGLGYRRVRLDLGNFAMDVPKFMQKSEGFDVAMHGYGVKLSYFPFAEQRGALAGVDAALAHVLVERQGSELSRSHRQLHAGMHVGYRIVLPAGFYVTPWFGASYAFGARDVTLGGATCEISPVTLFPAVHLGHRFL